MSKEKNKILKIIKDNKKNISLSLIILTFALIIGFGIKSNSKKAQVTQKNNSKKSAIQNTSKENTAAKDLAQKILWQMEDDIILGDKNAPVTLIEYASLSCNHCANFHQNVFPYIDKNYIKTGKVKFIFRDFPLNQPAALASVVARCHASNNNNSSETYYKFIKVLFETQSSWAFNNNFFEKLRSIAKLDSMSSQQFDDCVNNDDLINKILEKRLEAAKNIGINSTPSFVLNGKAIGGYRNFKKFKEVIDNELNNL
jgi:protein-disulfide isomerase